MANENTLAHESPYYFISTEDLILHFLDFQADIHKGEHDEDLPNAYAKLGVMFTVLRKRGYVLKLNHDEDLPVLYMETRDDSHIDDNPDH